MLLPSETACSFKWLLATLWLKTTFWQKWHWLWNAQVTWPNNFGKLWERGQNLLRIEAFNFLKSSEVNGSSPPVEMPRVSMATKKVAENSRLNIKALSLPINSLFLLGQSLGKTFIQLKAISIQYLMFGWHIRMQDCVEFYLLSWAIF